MSSSVLPALALLGLLVAGCDPSRGCRAVTLGSSLAGLDVVLLRGSSWTYAVNYPDQPAESFDTGPAVEHRCCAARAEGAPLSTCDAALDCSGEAFRAVDVYLLRTYSWDWSIDDHQGCYAAVKEGKIVAVWSRRRS